MVILKNSTSGIERLENQVYCGVRQITKGKEEGVEGQK